MAWEYGDVDQETEECTEGSQLTSKPRERVGLAVTRDGGKSWQYLLDIDDWEGHTHRHMNHSLQVVRSSGKVPPGAAVKVEVWVSIARQVEDHDCNAGNRELAVWRIDPSALVPRYFFSGTH